MVAGSSSPDDAMEEGEEKREEEEKDSLMEEDSFENVENEGVTGDNESEPGEGKAIGAMEGSMGIPEERS